jgi:hypothetical protein
MTSGRLSFVGTVNEIEIPLEDIGHPIGGDSGRFIFHPWRVQSVAADEPVG